MREIELYDIITLKDDSEYSVLNIENFENKKYLLIAPVNKEEIPDMKNIKIVEENIINNEIVIDEVEDEILVQKLTKQFLASLKKELIKEE